MSEIKSTLDLVMEKTRHLTLSQTEREEQKRIEVNKRLQGLLQKYQDDFLKKDNLKKELDNLKIAYDLNVDEMLADLLLSSLKMGQDNTVFLELLNEIFGLNISGLETIFQNFKAAVKSATKKRIDQIKTDLSEKRFISGSAVVPNLESDREWLSMLGHIMDEFDQTLNKEKVGLSKELSLD
jgi:flagellar biosynthesis component FlhA